MNPLTRFLFTINVQCVSASEHLKTETNHKRRKRKHKLEAGLSTDRNHCVYLLPYEDKTRQSYSSMFSKVLRFQNMFPDFTLYKIKWKLSIV